jgi:outer membrane biosynthesis protein TonB
MMQGQNYTIHRSNNKHKFSGLAGTFIIHGILALVLFFIVIYPPNPPLESMGMMMSLGEENMGGPSESPVENPMPQETYTPISEQTETTAPSPITQETDESVALPEKKEKKEVKEKTEKKIVKEQVQKAVATNTPELDLPRKVDQRSLFKKSTNNQSGNGGFGDGDVPGNEGRPDGDPNGSPDGQGTGLSGNGKGGDGPLKYELAGRSMKKLPSIEDNSKSIGKVVVRIVVDRDGNVVKAVPGQPGSTTIENALLEKAKQGALQTKFSPKSDGPEEQYGYITFVFRFRQ